MGIPGRRAGIAVAIAAMAAVVVLSNVLVQHPFSYRLGRLDLADLLTWGAFSYPLTFLVTDTTNRLLGPSTARRVVYVGFALAILLSAWASTPRIAIASGAAFLAGQLLDIGIFNGLRRDVWWKAPAFSSLAGSLADTLIFFSLAFAGSLAFFGAGDQFVTEAAPLLGLSPIDAPRWVSWALGDFSVKVLIAVVALIPYRVIVGYFLPLRPAAT